MGQADSSGLGGRGRLKGRSLIRGLLHGLRGMSVFVSLVSNAGAVRKARSASMLTNALASLGTETPDFDVVIGGLLNCVAGSEHIFFDHSTERNRFIAQSWQPLLNDLKKEQAAKILKHLDGDFGRKIDARITVELCRYASSKARWLSVMSMKEDLIRELYAMTDRESQST